MTMTDPIKQMFSFSLLPFTNPCHAAMKKLERKIFMHDLFFIFKLSVLSRKSLLQEVNATR